MRARLKSLRWKKSRAKRFVFKLHILVMQPTNEGVRHDPSVLLNRARDRRILVQ
jgi:hypothetical protein